MRGTDGCSVYLTAAFPPRSERVSELRQGEQPFAAIALEFLFFQAQKTQGILLDRLSMVLAAKLTAWTVGIDQELGSRLAPLDPPTSSSSSSAARSPFVKRTVVAEHSRPQ
jgi:hypothetical protein